MAGNRYNAEQAELLAIKVLEWIATNPTLFATFLNMTGSTRESITENYGNSEFLASVMDFLLMQKDVLILECCQYVSVSPDDPMKARRALPGGEEFNWT
ncbi:MAG: DUF3572 family protein [Rhodobacteraceae bacterium]|nr:DUF3572 domain-containing protein [Paracoccaceae bacterium]MDE2739760.1 DUF3572 domain-containing protein [Paracoccaceae bacterium]MDE2759677.1 DUF3572 domain-containing protein [Paracoccaceae bacterium]MDE2917061.1 DUF3572 domain-containing protein [Paracoccaceae bacterium]MXZ49751.1 DUF3572 family protein [Paracoccaceae bacterium]